MRLISLITLLALALGATPSTLAPVVAPVAPPERIVAYDAIAGESGWVATAHHLYLTQNEGATWQEVTPPLAGGVLLTADFVPSGQGWAVSGHPSGDGIAPFALARTTDFGATWRIEPLVLFAGDDPDTTIGRMTLDFASAETGVLGVRHVSSSNFNRWSEWRTADAGATWVRTRTAEDRAEDPAAPGNGLIRWQVEQMGRCTERAGRRICQQTTSLQATGDGGQSWRGLPLPAAVETSRQVTTPGSPSAAGPQGTMLVAGQGFDKCEIPTLDELYNWRWSSPYSSVNLYIGGSARACRNYSLTPDFLRAAQAMGWTFIPTWVGPQAPCTNYRSKISPDPATAASEGWREAHAAADALAALGLTEQDGTGSIVYYDMEAYNTGDGACNAAVQAFISGWDEGLHARGNLAGVYGTGSTLRLFAGLSQPPDAIWAAHWIYDAYEDEATVWNVYRLGNDVWSNHQRLRQYTGGHPETWGGLSMTIDANVLDGPIALAGPAPTPTPTVTPSATATPTATPTATVTPTATATRVPITPTDWVYLPMVVR